jgi:beta-lactamase regulating signal transducer with metallopeptidase domain
MSLSFFAEMALKSAVIAAIGLMLAMLLRNRTAADRAAVLRVAILLLLMLPVLSAFLPALQVEVAAAPALEPALASAAPAASVAVEAAGGAVEASAPSVFDDPGVLIALAYLGGLLMAAGRLLAGLWTLSLWTRAAEPVDCPKWVAAFERVRRETGLTDRARLLLSNDAPAPLSWGWRRPVILIDPDAARRPEDADAILEHEAAHIVRNDWAALIAARAVSTLFWFNPLVWALERSLVQNTEEAADSSAVRRVEPAHYAQTLLGYADQLCRSPLPANSMAGSSALGRRVKAILDGRFSETPSGSALAMLAIGLCIAFAAPVSAMKLVAATIAAPAPAPVPAAPPAPAVAARPVVSAVSAAIVQDVDAEAEARIDAAVDAAADATDAKWDEIADAPAAPDAPESAIAPEAPAAPPAPARAAAPPAPPAPPQGLLPVEALVEMQIHGVSARFIDEMAAAGYSRLSPKQLVAMRIHGVNADLARRAAARTGRRPSAEELVELAIHGFSR